MGFVRYVDRAGRDERIRELHATGMTVRAIAKLVGCHHTTVWEVANPDQKARYNAQRAARNTSPAGLQRQRDYRARKEHIGGAVERQPMSHGS